LHMSNPALREVLLGLRARLPGGRLSKHSGGDESPLRSDLFSAVQMEQHGKDLAASHRLMPGHPPDRLLLRLTDNEKVLVGVCRLLMAAVTKKRRIAPAGEWLLDNFYLIEEQIRTAKRHLPKGYSRELPRLRQGLSAGRPRVYDLALEIIAHGDGRVDPENLNHFVAAYQTDTTLKLGELWAIPIMLRLALIENLRRVAARIAAARTDQDLADGWADAMMAMAERDPKNLILVIADMARSNPPLSGTFVAELARRLQGQSSALALPLTWIEQQLAESDHTIEQLVQVENQQQAADQVSIGNSIGSLRDLGATDWRAFVETMSVVEQTLLEDPHGIYGHMEFAARDRYRHVIEKVAKHSPRSEPVSEAKVARAAIELAREATLGQDAAARETHVGFYLIDRGLARLERETQARLGTLESLRRQAPHFPLSLYLGAITLLTALFTASLLAPLGAAGLPIWLLPMFGLLALLGTSQLALALVNWLATLLATPEPLPRMDFSDGIPADMRTLVVTPTMLTSTEGIESLVEALEVRFLANRDDALHFGLLTDVRDALTETLPADAALVASATRRIAALNAKYPRASGDTFFLFHRPRRWNPRERVWMGYERKRGKLADLNALLRGDAADRFAAIVGDTSILRGVRYVITLDTDTQLPRDAAHQLIGAMAHPLNRAVYDSDRQLVSEGYGILQPRVGASLPGANRSRYARLHGSDAGIDPYTHAVSDVYQDWFQEGSFIGKGIYDVDVFELALKERFPENRILSHDLLEGCYARSGLLSDVLLYEDFPACYGADSSRRYRWTRGDWQVAQWSLPWVPGTDGRARSNPLSALSRWKLADNIRRSLVSTALTLLLILGWVFLESPGLWTLAMVGIVLIPALMTALLNLLRKPGDVVWRTHFAAALRAVVRQGQQALLTVVCLPYEALYSLDAMLRTLWRLEVSHQRLLQWVSSADLDRQGWGVESFFRRMWIGPALAAVTAMGLVLVKPALLWPALFWVAGPILLLWLASPAIAWWLSRPLTRREAHLSLDQVQFLGTVARKTWAFFETFVGPDDHWLPPDNYQEHPVPLVAHRTSPTNMGLSLLANLAAYDFGYLPLGGLLARTSGALRTMSGLERYRGHCYNWYDTQTLKPLTPLYVSSVDSGNLAGHLLTLQPGLLALIDAPILNARWLDGVNDSLRVLTEALEEESEPRRKLVVPDALAEFQRRLESVGQARPSGLAATRDCLEGLAATAEVVVRELAARSRGGSEDDANSEARALARQCRGMLDDLLFLVPWVVGPVVGQDDAMPSLRELARAGLVMEDAKDSKDDKDRTKDDKDDAVRIAGRRAGERIRVIEELAQLAGELAQMDFDFLFDEARKLLVIGYNVAERRQDASSYDLLASEARLASFVAIAQGQVPQESWFALGRLLTTLAGEPTLLSWSGSMFEYLMPLLVMPTYDNTLLDQTYRTAVNRQIAYGKERGVPWGVSESGYNGVDLDLNYQYRAFGVPGLGLKRFLSEDLVVAPYACALALMVAPEAACRNLQRLATSGLATRYGFFEAIDYTPSRLPRGQASAVVRSFMAHHQGMSLLSLAYLLLDRPMQQRFGSAPLFQATALLLQERIPKTPSFYLQNTGEITDIRTSATGQEAQVRVFDSPNTPRPEVQLLSNGRYHVMVTNAGGGYSRWKDLAVTRWREDTTRDAWGQFCYLRDPASGEVWSNAYQPTLAQPDSYEAIFSEGRAEFRRRDHEIETYTEIVISPEDDIELHRVRLTNHSRARRVIEITSYAEVVLAPPAADTLHPAFSNLFVQTEILHPHPAILCARRPRSSSEAAPWMFHQLVLRGAQCDAMSFETDRMRFIGRDRSVMAPAALREGTALSGSAGSVLDPIVAIRCSMTLEPDQSATIDLVTGIGDSREIAVGLVEKYQDQRLADRVFDLAWTHSQVVLRQLNASQSDVQLYGRLASSILYANASLRAEPSLLAQNRRGQSGLWSHAVSGDVPIVLCQIGDPANIALVQQLVQAHAYWRLKGLTVDLVIWNEDRAGYRQQLHDQILGLIAAGVEAHVMDRPGGIFVRPADQISDEDRILFQTVARAILSDSRGTLAEQLSRRARPERRVPRLRQTLSRFAQWSRSIAPPPVADTGQNGVGQDGVGQDSAQHGAQDGAQDGTGLLHFDNGMGGFTADGREYVITTAAGEPTPAPWVNVLANAHFGTVISASGMAYTWSENAHEFRLTPWHNDPVSDASGEAFYLRDEAAARSGRPRRCRLAARPPRAGGATPYVSRHGFGYSVFEHSEGGIHSELWVYVAWTHRSNTRCSSCAICRLDRAGSPRPAMSNGCSATCDPSRRCTSSPRSIPAAARCSPAIPTTTSSPVASPSSMSTIRLAP
jgi:cyclic beta-1,2-glucan synthetase